MSISRFDITDDLWTPPIAPRGRHVGVSHHLFELPQQLTNGLEGAVEHLGTRQRNPHVRLPRFRIALYESQTVAFGLR